jgi:hypothetical protein
MSLDEPQQNKMMTAPPAKKEFHFAATATHYAAVVYADTTAEAEVIYHQIKRAIGMPPPTINGPTDASIQQSTAAIDEKDKQ